VTGGTRGPGTGLRHCAAGHTLGLTAPWHAYDHAAHPRLRNGHIRTVATSRALVCLTIASALTAFAMFAATIHLIPCSPTAACA
jgi:hypothetical protein